MVALRNCEEQSLPFLQGRRYCWNNLLFIMLQFYSYPTGKLLVSAADQLYMTQMLRLSPGYKPAAIRVYLYCSLAFVVYKLCGSGKDN